MSAVRAGYKQTEVGVIPEDWEAVPLGQLASLKSGKSITQSSISDLGVFPVYGGNGLRGFTETKTHAGSFPLIGRQGALCGNVNFATGEFFASEHAIVVSPGARHNPQFLFYVLKNFNLNALSESSAQPGLSVGKLRPVLFPCPSTFAEQQAIAETLEDADGLIEALGALIAKKRAVKQGAMQDLLTGHHRLPGFQGEWGKHTLGELAQIFDGTHQTPKYVDDGVPFYSVENVTSGNFANTKYISQQEHEFLTRRVKIEKGDVLMTRIGSIGECKLVDWNVDGSFYVSLALLKFRRSGLADYFVHYSKSDSFRTEIELHSLAHAVSVVETFGANLACR